MQKFQMSDNFELVFGVERKGYLQPSWIEEPPEGPTLSIHP